MYEVEPGNKQGPFHTHHANEEWAIVLRGEPTLRTHEGEQQLRQGDVVAFPRGKEGAHQIRNDTDAPVRVLMLSTLIGRTSSSPSTAARSARGASPVTGSSSPARGPSSNIGRTRTQGTTPARLRQRPLTREGLRPISKQFYCGRERGTGPRQARKALETAARFSR